MKRMSMMSPTIFVFLYRYESILRWETLSIRQEKFKSQFITQSNIPFVCHQNNVTKINVCIQVKFLIKCNLNEFVSASKPKCYPDCCVLRAFIWMPFKYIYISVYKLQTISETESQLMQLMSSNDLSQFDWCSTKIKFTTFSLCRRIAFVQLVKHEP